MIVEPLQRVLLPEPGFLQAVRDATKRHGIVLVFDEVVTGFRIAWGGAQERYGVVPDIAIYGKAMSGGFPMAALVGRADVMAPLDGRQTSDRTKLAWASGTLNGNPICAAAGNAALDVLSSAVASTTSSTESAGGCGRGSRSGGQSTASRCSASARTSSSACASCENEQPKSWVDLLEADKELGLRVGGRAPEAGAAREPEREVLHLRRPQRAGRRPHARGRRRGVRSARLTSPAPRSASCGQEPTGPGTGVWPLSATTATPFTRTWRNPSA